MDKSIKRATGIIPFMRASCILYSCRSLFCVGSRSFRQIPLFTLVGLVVLQFSVPSWHSSLSFWTLSGKQLRNIFLPSWGLCISLPKNLWPGIPYGAPVILHPRFHHHSREQFFFYEGLAILRVRGILLACEAWAALSSFLAGMPLLGFLAWTCAIAFALPLRGRLRIAEEETLLPWVAQKNLRHLRPPWF